MKSPFICLCCLFLVALSWPTSTHADTWVPGVSQKSYDISYTYDPYIWDTYYVGATQYLMSFTIKDTTSVDYFSTAPWGNEEKEVSFLIMDLYLPTNAIFDAHNFDSDPLYDPTGGSSFNGWAYNSYFIDAFNLYYSGDPLSSGESTSFRIPINYYGAGSPQTPDIAWQASLRIWDPVPGQGQDFWSVGDAYGTAHYRTNEVPEIPIWLLLGLGWAGLVAMQVFGRRAPA